MARFDKYDPISGGFRAPLAADWEGPIGVPVGVGLDANGRIVPGAGQSGIVGVVVVDGNVSPHATRSHTVVAGDVMDNMTDGEIVDCSGLAAGTAYFAASDDGEITTTAGGTPVGHTVEAQRLIVRVGRAAA